MSDTLDKYVGELFDINDADDASKDAAASTTTENADVTTTDTSVEGTNNNAGGLNPQAQADAGHNKSADSTGNNTVNKTEPNAERQSVKAFTPGRQRLPADAEGNLVDPSTGRIVAKAGTERALYESARNFHRQMQEHRTQAEAYQRELDTTKAHLTAFREAAQLPTSLGLQPQEVTTAMQFMAHFKANPVEAAKKVLTEVLAMGHNIEDLKGSVDMAALQRMIQQEVAPFKQNLTTQQQHEAAQAERAKFEAEADRELEEHFDTFPWAQQQQVEIHQLMEADERLSLREATLMLQAWAYKNGYDISRPLKAQHEAATTGQQQQQQAQPTRMNNAQMAAPNGTGGGQIVPRVNAVANHDLSYRDIVAQTLSEHGITVNR